MLIASPSHTIGAVARPDRRRSYIGAARDVPKAPLCACFGPARSVPLGARKCGNRGLGDLFVLLTGAGADANAADDMTVDDHRNPTWQVDALSLGCDRKLDVDAGGDVAGRNA